VFYVKNWRPENDYFVGIEPEKVKYLGTGLSDFVSKTR
jgi:hypothetical protein